MAQRRSPVHWYEDLRSGETRPFPVQAGQRVWVTHAKLVDPASVPAGQTVRVALRTSTGDSESLELSAESPSARVRSMEVLEDYFWLEREEDGYDDAVVRFRGRCVNLLAPETVEDEDGGEESDVEDDADDDGAVLGIEEGEDMVDGDGISDDDDWEAVLDAYVAGLEDDVEMVGDHEVSDDDDRITDHDWEEEESDDDDRITDHDWEEEESDDEFEVRGAEDELDVNVADQVNPSRLLGGSARRFAATGSTAGYMRMRVVTAAEAEESHGNDTQILVHYSYTRFSAASFDDGDVEACGSTMEHQLRFIADGSSHGARSLAWAGASLVPLIYPGHSSNRLRKLWSRLIAGVSIPPDAARVEVFVEVGILRPADRTPETITHMCDILKDMMMAQPWPEGFTGMELHLPDPVRCGHDDEDDDGEMKGKEEHPGKRRRVDVSSGQPVRCGHDQDDDGNDRNGEKRSRKRRRVVSAGETCTVCLELLEGDDLAAWPGCGKPHVFHGRCLELVLEKSHACPICRRRLY